MLSMSVAQSEPDLLKAGLNSIERNATRMFATGKALLIDRGNECIIAEKGSRRIMRFHVLDNAKYVH